MSPSRHQPPLTIFLQVKRSKMCEEMTPKSNMSEASKITPNMPYIM